MNFVYFSPNFPTFGWKFCRYLKENGVTVLGIGDEPYDRIQPELKDALTEYYVVGNLQDYDQVYRACAYFTFRYGKIDRLMSNNEFWLITEAKLRTDFNIDGVKYPAILTHKQKSLMKDFFTRAGVAVAPFCLPKNVDDGKAFVKKYGYPVVVKPDDGVGACDTYTLFNDADLEKFFASKQPVQYIMEQFIDGHVETFDGVVDGNNEIRFCASQIYHQSLMDTVVNDDCIMYHSEKQIASDIEKAGRAIVKAYGIKNTFFHFEFFRTLDNKGRDKIVALEVNMRPPGGMITDLYEASHDVNVYKLWADVLTTGETGDQDVTQKRFAGYASRKNRFSYVLSHDDIMAKYGQNHIMETDVVNGITARAMGDRYYLVYADTKEELLAVIDDINARV